jgi:hypothetical protein
VALELGHGRESLLDRFEGAANPPKAAAQHGGSHIQAAGGLWLKQIVFPLDQVRRQLQPLTP